MAEKDLVNYRNAVWRLMQLADAAGINTNEVRDMDDILFNNYHDTHPPCSCLDPSGYNADCPRHGMQ